MTIAGISKLNALTELRVLSASSSLREDPTAPPMNLSNLRELRQLYISPLRDDDLASIANLKRASIEDARVQRGKKRKPQNVVRKAPDFSVETLNRNTLTRDDFKGNVLLLYFWFTSCKPCVASTPEVRKSYETVTTEFPDFRMLSLSTDSYDALVRQHVDKHELSWPQARIGPDSKLQAEFDVEGFPHFVVIDREGNVRYNGPSGSELDKQLRTALEENRK